LALFLLTSTMKASAIIVFALLGLAIAGNPFDAYVKQYKKTYKKGTEEYTRREATWQANVRKIKQHQAAAVAAGEQPWLGINKFTDMSAEEFKNSGYIMKESLKVGQQDARSCLANGVTLDRSKLPEDTPTSWDWRTKGVVKPIQNQGQCGSCWAFSTIASIETALALNNSQLSKLSEQEIVDCSTGCVLEDGQQVCNQGCNGGWPWSALTDIISWNGEELETVYPYTGVDGTCARTAANTLLPISNYTCLSGPGLASEDDMAAFVYQNGVISIAMDAGILQSYKKGIIKPGRFFDSCSKTQLDHAINIVGFGVESNENYWIVRNSWGADWGEDGYFRIIRGEGACGLNAGVVFPNV